MICIVINGLPRSGKDSFVNFCSEYLASKNISSFNISSVDRVKMAAYTLGWDGTKDQKGRKFLSDLKDLSTVNYNGPLNYMKSCIDENSKDVYFFMIREPSEIHKFVKEYPKHSITVCITRNNLQEFDNHADQNVYEYDYGVYIDNNKDIEDLQKEAIEFAEYILKFI